MDNNKKNVPEIRFPGFTDPWEQRKLRDMIRQPVTDGPHETPRLLEEGIPFLSVEAIHDGIIDVKKCRGFISNEDDMKYKKKYIPEIGDVYFTKAATIGRVAVVKELGFNIWSPIGAIKPDFSVLQSEYLYYYLQTEIIQKSAIIASNNGTQHNLAMDAIEDFDIIIPTDLKEQERISSFISAIDNIITLHQRKCDELKIYKKGLLQQMFPQPGESIPRVRFPGFTDPWEQRKLLDLLNQPVTDGPHETPNLVENGVPFISVDAIVDNKIDFSRVRGYITEDYDVECCRKYKPQLHDVYMVKSGSTTGKVAIVETTERFNIWSPLAAMRCGGVTDPYFLYFLLQTDEMQNQVFDKASHGTQPNLSMRQLEKFDVVVPNNIDEQVHLGMVFKSLDNLITLHQRKCDELKTYKKGLLQKMFV